MEHIKLYNPLGRFMDTFFSWKQATGFAELNMVQDVVARPVVVSRYGVAGIVPGADSHVDMNGSVGNRNNADNSVSADNNRSGKNLMDHIKFCNPHGRLTDTPFS